MQKFYLIAHLPQTQFLFLFFCIFLLQFEKASMYLDWTIISFNLCLLTKWKQMIKNNTKQVSFSSFLSFGVDGQSSAQEKSSSSV